MTYKETTEYLFTQLPFFQNEGAKAYKPGLERVETLLALVGSPHKQLKAIHVAGTNGKGSTTTMLASILTEAGYRVGLFTSPHLVDFRERIRIDGEMIPEEAVIRFVEKIRPQIPTDLHPSFFELSTAMAFDYFVQSGVDLAVIEVGMGGRLDSTNVLQPLLSIITNVSLDHTAFLGSNLTEIAHEKAGIIKPHTPIILGNSSEADVLAEVQQRAEELQAPLTIADQQGEIEMYLAQEPVGYKLVTKHFGTLYQPLGGSYQIENSATLLEAIKTLRQRSITIPDEAVANGLQGVQAYGLRGRLEVIHQGNPTTGEPEVIIDTGHNPGAWHYLQPILTEWSQEGGLIALMGMAADKDVDSVLHDLPREAHYFLCQAHTDRAMPAQELAAHATRAGLKVTATEPDPFDAYQKALAYAQEHQIPRLFIGGSNFVIGDLLPHL